MLFKNVFRTLKKRIFQIVLLGFIITLSAFIYVSMSYSIGAIKTPTESFFESYNQEDFNITILNQITEEEHILIGNAYLSTYLLRDLYSVDQEAFEVIMNHRMTQFEQEFSFTKLEPRLYKDVYFKEGDLQHTIRILKDAKEINISYITKGTKPIESNQIALTEVYAKHNHYQIGDTIKLNQSEFVITGFVLFPDYSLAVFGEDFIINNKTRSMGLLSNQGFDHIEGLFGIEISGVFTEEMSNKDLFKNHNQPFVLNILLTENTIRSGAIYEELKSGQAMGLLMGLIISSMAVMIVAILVSKILNEQRGAIGILKALGYKNKEIAIPYLIFIIIISIPGLIFGYFLGFFISGPLKDLYMTLYLLPDGIITHTPLVFLTSIILPLIILLGLGYIVIYKLLAIHPIKLMNPSIQKPKKISKLFNIPLKKMSLIQRLKHAYILRNPVRFMVFMTGVFTSVFMILLSLSMIGIFDQIQKDYYDSHDVNYIGYCDIVTLCQEESIEFDKVIEIPFVLLEDKSVTLIGLDRNNKFHPLFQKKIEITHLLDEPGIIITRSIAMEKRFKVGDYVTVSYGNLSLELKVLGIQDEYGSNKIYVNREAISLGLTEGLSTDFYNVVYTKDLPNATYLQVIDINDLLLQTKELSQMGNIMSYVLILVSMSIGIVVMILITVLSIEANYYDISLFKVIGYNDHEIEKVFINSYLIYAVIIFCVTIPITYLFFEIIMWYLATLYGMIFPMTLTIMKLIIGLILTLLLFYISVPLAKKKLNQLSLNEALKIYQN
jgi:putative ABC transport system permease protein